MGRLSYSSHYFICYTSQIDQSDLFLASFCSDYILLERKRWPGVKWMAMAQFDFVGGELEENDSRTHRVDHSLRKHFTNALAVMYSLDSLPKQCSYRDYLYLL